VDITDKLALAVGPDIEYAVINTATGKYLLAKSLIGGYVKEFGFEDLESALENVSETVKGSELAGIKYERLFDYYADETKFEVKNAWQVLVDSYVADNEGTGVVHQSPAYGEDDQKICEAAGIPVYVSVNERGEYVSVITDFVGMHVFEANKPITQKLKEMGRLVKQASYDHPYHTAIAARIH